METMNQKLTVRQKTQLDEILRDGEYSSPVRFARDIKNFSKIRHLDTHEVRAYLGFIFTKAANLAGFKNPISDINKNDIRQMVMTQYSGLSLEEIDYAFMYDRYSGEPIEHFQLFNAVYVSKVLKRYKKYITQIKFDNNIPLSEPRNEKTYTEEEKAKIHEEYLLMVYDELIKNKYCDSAHLLWDKIRNKHGKRYEILERLKKIQIKKYLREKPKSYDFDKDGGKNTVYNV